MGHPQQTSKLNKTKQSKQNSHPEESSSDVLTVPGSLKGPLPRGGDGRTDRRTSSLPRTLSHGRGPRQGRDVSPWAGEAWEGTAAWGSPRRGPAHPSGMRASPTPPPAAPRRTGDASHHERQAERYRAPTEGLEELSPRSQITWGAGSLRDTKTWPERGEGDVAQGLGCERLSGLGRFRIRCSVPWGGDVGLWGCWFHSPWPYRELRCAANVVLGSSSVPTAQQTLVIWGVARWGGLRFAGRCGRAFGVFFGGGTAPCLPRGAELSLLG